MVCDSCGSSNTEKKNIENYMVIECQVCGSLHGDDEAIQKISEVREAQEKEIDPIIFPLHKTLEKNGGFQIQFSCPGYPHEKVPPYVSWRGENWKSLETLAQGITEANKQTKVHWIISISYQRSLMFTLKPEFHHDPYNISAEQISMAQKDLATLYDHLAKIFQGK